MKRTITVDDELWEAAVSAAGQETADRGKRVSVSEWIRQAMRERLDTTREGKR